MIPNEYPQSSENKMKKETEFGGKIEHIFKDQESRFLDSKMFKLTHAREMKAKIKT